MQDDRIIEAWGRTGVDTPPGTRRGGARPAPLARYRMTNSAGLSEVDEVL